MAAFATTAELAAYWRPLTPEEVTRATALLDTASDRLRLMYRPADLDDKVTDDTLYGSAVKNTVLESVKRAMTSPIDVPPVETYGQTAGPYSENFKFVNPGGDLYFKKSELKLLGFGGQTVDSWSTTTADIYLSWES